MNKTLEKYKLNNITASKKNLKATPKQLYNFRKLYKDLLPKYLNLKNEGYSHKKIIAFYSLYMKDFIECISKLNCSTSKGGIHRLLLTDLNASLDFCKFYKKNNMNEKIFVEKIFDENHIIRREEFHLQQLQINTTAKSLKKLVIANMYRINSFIEKEDIKLAYKFANIVSHKNLRFKKSIKDQDSLNKLMFDLITLSIDEFIINYNNFILLIESSDNSKYYFKKQINS